VTDMKSCVIYDVKSGQILHTHSATSAPGARVPTQKEVEQKALELFRRNEAHPGRDVQILHLQESDLKVLPLAVKVDHATRRLVIQEKTKRTAE
jgi:hypothetical protein